MKKILLALAMYMACTGAGAQQVNKTLLNGKWGLSAMYAGGFTFHKDSMQQDIKNMIDTKSAGAKVSISFKDSLKLMKSVVPIFHKLFKTYARFDAGGHFTLVLYGMGAATKKSGKYEWTADGNLETKSGKSPSETFLVAALTAARLVLTSDNGKDDKDHIELSFTKE